MSPVFIFFAVVLCVFVWSKLDLFRSSSRIPGPFVGDVQFLSKIRPEALFKLVGELRQTYRSTFRIWMGTYLWVFLHTTEETREALNETSLVRADTFKLLNVLIGNGLLISEGKHWHTRRRALGPAFRSNVLAGFTERIYHHAEIFVKKLIEKKTVDVDKFIFPCVLDAICETSMGKDLRTQEDDDSVYTKAFHEASHLLFKRMVNPLLSSDFIYRKTDDHKRLRNAVNIIHKLTDEVIKEQADVVNSQDAKTNRSLLHILLTTEVDGQSLSFQEIKDEVNTFLFAGVDTTTAAMGFVLYCLAKYPECQEKLFQEISSQPGSRPDVYDMPYLEMFVKECLRMYTIVPLTGRQVTKKTQICSNTFYPGTTLWINMYGLSHDEEYFSKPDVFKPERFESDAPEIPPFAFIPFSGGPHSCIGRKYAMVLLKILTVAVVMKAKVSLKNPYEELDLIAEMVLKSKNGINLKFKKRGR